MESITRFLTMKLKLKINQAKNAVPGPRLQGLRLSFAAGEEPRERIAPNPISRFLVGRPRFAESRHFL